jgi:hypothetical protein
MKQVTSAGIRGSEHMRGNELINQYYLYARRVLWTVLLVPAGLICALDIFIFAILSYQPTLGAAFLATVIVGDGIFGTWMLSRPLGESLFVHKLVPHPNGVVIALRRGLWGSTRVVDVPWRRIERRANADQDGPSHRLVMHDDSLPRGRIMVWLSETDWARLPKEASSERP